MKPKRLRAQIYHELPQKLPQNRKWRLLGKNKASVTLVFTEAYAMGGI
jgi:hypothetical protein